MQPERDEAGSQAISRKVGHPSRPSSLVPAAGDAWVQREACKERTEQCGGNYSGAHHNSLGVGPARKQLLGSRKYPQKRVVYVLFLRLPSILGRVVLGLEYMGLRRPLVYMALLGILFAWRGPKKYFSGVSPAASRTRPNEYRATWCSIFRGTFQSHGLQSRFIQRTHT